MMIIGSLSEASCRNASRMPGTKTNCDQSKT
jgi:hypothetical protein